MELERPGNAKKKRREAMALERYAVSASDSASLGSMTPASTKAAGGGGVDNEGGREADPAAAADFDNCCDDDDINSGRRTGGKHARIMRSVVLGIPPSN
jgi:hypothetical protein